LFLYYASTFIPDPAQIPHVRLNLHT